MQTVGTVGSAVHKRIDTAATTHSSRSSLSDAARGHRRRAADRNGGIKRPGALGDDPQHTVDLSDTEADRRGGTHEAVAVEGLLCAEAVARPLRSDGE